MTLIGNYNVFNKTAGRFISGTSLSDTRANFNKNGLNRNAFAGQASIEGVTQKSAIPNGYLPPYSWVLPLKAGGIASTSFISGSGNITNVNLAGGKNIESTITASGGITSASMQLILSAVATLSGSGGITADIAGKLEAAASLAGSGNITGALGALASAVALMTGSASVSATPQAKGALSANITPFTELSPQSLASAVWNKAASELNVLNSIGKKIVDSLPTGIKRGEALNNFQFFMTDALDHVSGKTGLSSFTKVISKDGGSFQALTNSVTEIGNGVYKIDLTATELDAAIITVSFSATGADDRVLTIITEG